MELTNIAVKHRILHTYSNAFSCGEPLFFKTEVLSSIFAPEEKTKMTQIALRHGQVTRLTQLG